MSGQAFDPSELQEAIYGIGDVASDPNQAAQRLRALLGQLEDQGGGQAASQQPPGVQHQAAGVGPGGTSSVAGGEALPYPELDPFPIGQLGERVDQVGRQVATMGEQDREAALYTFADQLNRSLDEHARQEAPHHYPAPPVSTDEELGKLAGRINQAGIDPGSLDEHARYALAEELNATIGGINDAHLRRQDDWEQQRAAAERQRQTRARQQDSTAKTLRALAGQLDGAATPGR